MSHVAAFGHGADFLISALGWEPWAGATLVECSLLGGSSSFGVVGRNWLLAPKGLVGLVRPHPPPTRLRDES